MKPPRRGVGRRKCIAVIVGVSIVLASLWNVLVAHRSVSVKDRQDEAGVVLRHSSSSSACAETEGVFHIGIADIEGGVGTALYQLILLQLDYAERHNLTPWVHLLPNVSHVIDDERFATTTNPHIITAVRRNVSKVGPSRKQHWRHVVPGNLLPADSSLPERIEIPGDGIWNRYFEPVSAYTPKDTSCTQYATIPLSDIALIIPGLHGFGKIRCWRYDYLPEYERRKHQSWEYWIASSRATAARLVQTYIRPREHLVEAARRLNPPATNTLGMHIRHSDKAAGRKVVPVSDFLPYVAAFIQAGGEHIYLATDSIHVIETIQQTWPKTIVARIRWSDSMMRSNDTKAVFDLAPSHHQSNQDAIIEILALSHCRFLLHGLSALSEAAIWHNPNLSAVNLEDDSPLSPEAFQTLVEFRDRPKSEWPTALYAEEVWYQDIAVPAGRVATAPSVSHTACDGFDGVLWIRKLKPADMAASAFFVTVAEQLVYAHENNLKPWVYLDVNVDTLFDPKVHNIDREQRPLNRTQILPKANPHPSHNGIWASYFEPVSDFVPTDRSCLAKRIVEYHSDTSDNTHSNMDVSKARPYFKPRKYLTNRAGAVMGNGRNCLGVHIRLADKSGRKIRAGEYVPYIEAFVRAGGDCIYLATDTEKAIRYILNNIDLRLLQLIHVQGNHTVRSEKGDVPTHTLDDHHRVNSETLVDILALSKCVMLVHSTSALSDAVKLLNPSIKSINLEQREPPSPKKFEMISRFVLGKDDTIGLLEEEKLIEPRILCRTQPNRPCNANAIVYLAQKNHSSYGRDSYSSLLKSIDLLKQNYLAQNGNLDRVDIFIFHTNEFNAADLDTIETRLGVTGLVRLVDLSRTSFWTRPRYNDRDRPEDWYAWPLFSEGYRRMMHWFAIDIWQFFVYLNKRSSCNYRYIFRMDEDSYIHSPINYDIFDFMKSHNQVYGFRMCSYEMQVTRRMTTMWINRHENFVPKRQISLDMCGFYNNLFVADLHFFTRPDVAAFLDFIDRQGHIYRRRLGDLMIHSMAVYWFAKTTEIHRFLDFTYEHGTRNNTDGCLMWGGMQAGYNDPNATVSQFYNDLISKGCSVNSSTMSYDDLSPSYNRLSMDVSLLTVTAGRVELPTGKGILSG